MITKNWHPISLLNVNYKLCARALAGRLFKVIQYVIALGQTCGVLGRFIGENVALLRNVIEYADEFNLPLAILSLDQEKAFDGLDWPFLFSTLSSMGFGPNFISWVKFLYKDIRSAVLLNGHSSRSFKPSRGVRQSCPLSPSSMYLLWKFWLSISVLTLPSSVFACLVLLILYPFYLFMLPMLLLLLF